MGHDNLEAIIAETLEALDTSGGRAEKQRAQADHVIDRYVALCREGECQELARTESVTLPITPAGDGASPVRANFVSSAARRVLARVKRR